MNYQDMIIFLLAIGIMLLVAKILGEFFIKIRQPAIIGEILAGIILGPTLFGKIFPSAYAWLFPAETGAGIALEGLIFLAIVMLMLVLGIEVDLSLVFKNSKAAFYTSVLGTAFPIAGGFAMAFLFPNYFGLQDEKLHLAFGLFVGTSMAISALPVIARTLMDLNIFKTEVGVIIITAAMFGDLAGWIIFSVILGMINPEHTSLGFFEMLLFILVFVTFMLTFGRQIIWKAIPVIQKRYSHPGTVINFIFIIGIILAAFTESIGLHAIFGSFIAGVAIGETGNLRENTREAIQNFVRNIFAPLFFVSIGLRINFIENFDLMLVVSFSLLAFITKIVGSGAGAYLAGVKGKDSLIIGFALNSRGVMQILLGILALEYLLIDERVFVAVVIMALLTSITSGPLMTSVMRRKEKFSFQTLLHPSNVLFTSAGSKETVITELIDFLSVRFSFDKEEAFREVLKKEEINPSVIDNHLALPHAKINIKRPIIALGVSPQGIKFGSPDEPPSRMILLLLTPLGENELQLRLLSEIVGYFREKKKIDWVLESANKDEIIKRLKTISSS